MSKSPVKTKIFFLSLATALMVGLINTATTVIAYTSFMPKNGVVDNTLISETPEADDLTELPLPDTPVPPVDSSSTSSPKPSSVKANSSTKQVRADDQRLKAGQRPTPGSVTQDPDGHTVYHWCTGKNPNLEDGVCEAIISIAANPTPSNIHLGEKARKSLSMLPKDTSITMDESSWKATSTTAGTMNVMAHTNDYGDVPVIVNLEKINGVWVVVDGRLA
jgi:hypothetical protein